MRAIYACSLVNVRSRNVHLQTGTTDAVCGTKANLLTADASAVTCKLCLKKIGITSRPAHLAPKPTPVPSRGPISFFTKVAGVTFTNSDGVSRQEIVARCSVGESLILLRDPKNPFDTGAVKVTRLNGEQLGYLPQHVTRGGDPSGLAHEMDRGDEYHCRVSSITGGGIGFNLGVNVEVIAGRAPDETPSAHRSYPDLMPRSSHMGLWLLVGSVVVVWFFLLIRSC